MFFFLLFFLLFFFAVVYGCFLGVISVETVRQTRPEVLDLLRPLQANATRLMGVGEKLDLNVKALREKIELAREQANRVSLWLQDDAKKSHVASDRLECICNVTSKGRK